MALADLKKTELIALCEEHDLDTSGVKADLVARLEPVVDWDEAEATEEIEAPSEPVEAKKPVKAAPVLKTLEDYSDLTDEEFVKAAYVDCLGREADEDGLRHYTRNIAFHKNMGRMDLLHILRNVD